MFTLLFVLCRQGNSSGAEWRAKSRSFVSQLTNHRTIIHVCLCTGHGLQGAVVVHGTFPKQYLLISTRAHRWLRKLRTGAHIFPLTRLKNRGSTVVFSNRCASLFMTLLLRDHLNKFVVTRATMLPTRSCRCFCRRVRVAGCLRCHSSCRHHL